MVPFAPPVQDWTEEHYTIFGLVELALGNRKEVTKEEREDIEFAEQVEQLIDSGDPDWLSKVEEYMKSGASLDDIPFDDMYTEIDKEQKARGQ